MLSLFGCADPVGDAERAALGPEIAGIAEGPLHRADQPCLLCHDGDHASDFSFAGTIHTAPEGPAVSGVRVRLVDGRDRTFEAETNCAGNFFVRRSDFVPVFPVHVELAYGALSVAMETPIRREGSCAGCHGEVPGRASVGPVFLSALGVTKPGNDGCAP